MQKFSIYCITGLLVLLIAGIYGCKKVNGINNGQVVETPYSLYFSDTAGALFNSTDGKNEKVIFTSDGVPCLNICTAGTNLLWSKADPHIVAASVLISIDNGLNFNHTYDYLTSLPDVACNFLPINLNQPMILNVAAWQRVYTLSQIAPGDGTRLNYMGLVHNDTFGAAGHWVLDTVYTQDSIGLLPVAMTSLTQLANGTVCGLAYDPDMYHVRNFYKNCKDDASCSWMENTGNPDGVGTIFQYNPNGLELPPNGGYVNPSYFTLGHFNNRLIAIDNKCTYGAWYSDDVGRNWKQCTGLPTNVPLLCVASPFEQVCLIGTDSAGLYMYNPNTGSFEPNNNGLSRYLKVRSISFKENVYKNNTTQQFVYLATDKGIFQSTDGGHNWIQTIPGNFVAIY